VLRLRVVPWKSNFGDAGAALPSALRSAATCVASSRATLRANVRASPRRRPPAPAAVEKAAAVDRLLVERGLEVLERQRVLEDRDVAGGHLLRRRRRGDAAEQARAEHGAAGGDAGAAEEVGAAVAGLLGRLGDRAVAVDHVQGEHLVVHDVSLSWGASSGGLRRRPDGRITAPSGGVP
jgi:hypothetical protein